MKTIFFETLYGVNQITFNVSDNGEVKTHCDPITGLEYAYASSANVKRNLKERFSELSGLETPKTEFKKKASSKNKKIEINPNGSGEQGGVSIFIDKDNPNHIATIFGAWTSDVSDNDKKYVKASLKSSVRVSDMLPVHPLLQYLNKKEVGVFVGDHNSAITIELDKKKTVHNPSEASEYVGCTIEEAKKIFSEQRLMNMYQDKKTANGIYQEVFAIEIETFGKIRLSTCNFTEEEINKLKDDGWREMEIRGDKYLAPKRDVLLGLWENLVDAMLTWDFSSNNSLHGNQKEALRYSISMNANKIHQCNMGRLTINDKGKKVAELSLHDHPSVQNFNTLSLSSWTVCDNIKLDIDADIKAKEALIKLGEENIL